MNVPCSHCGGKGTVSVADDACSATILVGHETVECFAARTHPGEPHMAVLPTPCFACGGYNEHHDSCIVYDAEAVRPRHLDREWYSWDDGDVALTRRSDAEGYVWRDRYMATVAA